MPLDPNTRRRSFRWAVGVVECRDMYGHADPGKSRRSSCHHGRAPCHPLPDRYRHPPGLAHRYRAATFVFGAFGLLIPLVGQVVDGREWLCFPSASRDYCYHDFITMIYTGQGNFFVCYLAQT